MYIMHQKVVMPAITEPAVESAKCEKISEVLKPDSVPSKLEADALKVEDSSESKKETKEPKAEEMSEAKTVPVEDGDKKESAADAADLEKGKDGSVPDENNKVPNQPSVETTVDVPAETNPAEEPTMEVKVAETEVDAKVEDTSQLEPAKEPTVAIPVKNTATENGAAVNGSNKEEPALVKDAVSETITGEMEVDLKPSETSATSSDTASATKESDSAPAENAPVLSEPTPVLSESNSACSDPGFASAKPGSASAAEPTPEDIARIEGLKQEGKEHLLRKNYFAAADSFGKVLEIQAPLYGELSEKLAETYFLYGAAMLEYGKTEGHVLGEGVAKKDADEDDDEEEEEMDVDGEPAEETSEGKDGDAEQETSKAVNGEDSGDKTVDDAEKTVDGKEEDEESFCVAWEMLELAKTTFTKAKNQKRLADTLMKLGDVGIETGKPEAITEMLQALEVRKSTFPAHHRIIPETHYTIGCAYAFFQIYDEAAEQFDESKKCLLQRIESLAKSENKDDIDEIEEMKKLIPEIEDRIKDMLESKKDASKIKEAPAAEGESSSEAAVKPTSDDKPVTNISHLIKRKRTLGDVAAERAAKISRAEEGAIPVSAEGQSAPKEVAEESNSTEKPAEAPKGTETPNEVVEKAKTEETDGENVEQKVEVVEDTKDEHQVSEKFQKKEDAEEKSDEKKDAEEKSELMPETVGKSEEKPEIVEKLDATESAETEKSDKTAEKAEDVAMDQS